MYLHDCLPLPWRALRAIERARLAWPVGRAVALQWQEPGMPGAVTLAALGDVFPREPPPAPGHVFAGLAAALERADVACCNLEAPVATVATPAGPLGSALRATPEAPGLLRAAGIGVVNVAGNHALDAGEAGFAESVGRLEEAGLAVCGVAGHGAASRLLVRAAGGLRLGFLGYCDDHAPVASHGGSRPALAVPERMLDEVAVAAAAVDVLVVQLHWGYEFRLHPLRRHRDLARALIHRGARLVLCHHAHVPMGLERHDDGLIAYGLGNALFPRTPYMQDGHPWSDRSVLLEVRLSRQHVVGARLAPFRLDPQGLPQASAGGEGRALMRALAIASARLGDERFMERCERAQLVFDAATLLRAIAAARERNGAVLGARLDTLALPRQRALIANLAMLPGTAALAALLDRLCGAAAAGEDPRRAFDAEADQFAAGLAALCRLFDWRAALAARLP
ncbi:MAG: CapA family protein [Gammaproteobacteria bacterium]|nr:CapA family protein [Gammaproteobacteria bacterium]